MPCTSYRNGIGLARWRRPARRYAGDRPRLRRGLPPAAWCCRRFGTARSRARRGDCSPSRPWRRRPYTPGSGPQSALRASPGARRGPTALRRQPWTARPRRSQVNGARGGKVRYDVRHAIARVVIGAEIQLLWSRLGRLAPALVAHSPPPARGILVGPVHAGVIAVNRSRKAAEAVLQRQGDAARSVVLELRQADEHIGVFERAV